MSVNVLAVSKIQSAARWVDELIDMAQPRGALCGVNRERVAQVSRTAKMLRAIGKMVRDDPQLVDLLSELAPVT